MGIKSILKDHLSPQQMKAIKGPIMYARYVKSKMSGTYGLKEANTDYVEKVDTYSLPGKHVFFGYYDLQQLDRTEERLLVHVLDARECDPSKDSVDLMYIERATGKFVPITSTRAWSWQQGSRLRWHPMREDCVVFNAFEDGHYAACVWNIRTQEREAIYPLAFYDVTPDFRYGLSVDFARLQRLRPGYGYSCVEDDTAGIRVPENSGITRYNIETGETKLLVSLQELASNAPDDKDTEHYINHIAVSPSGQYFTFFHLWTSTHTAKWDMKFYVADIETGELTCLEDKYIISHYCWQNDDVMLTTTVPSQGGSPKYIEYNIKEKTSVVIEGSWLNRDGHPSYIHGTGDFISDTYPLSCLQYVFMEKGAEGTELIRLYSDPRLFDDKRCDLHPRLTQDNRFITVDSTYENRVRHVVLLEMKPGWNVYDD